MIGIDELRQVHERLKPYIKSLPMEHYPELDKLVGNGIKIWLKPEILQPTKSFKVRNAFAALLSFEGVARTKGMVAASTGNLGQAFALAGSMLHVPVCICVKEQGNPLKNAAIRAYGAELIVHGNNYDEAYANAISIAEERGIPYIRSSEHKYAFAGAATIGLEIFAEGLPLDRVVLAVGSGAHAAGAGLIGKSVAQNTIITGIQARTSCTIHDHWHHKDHITPETDTIADAISMGPNYYKSSVELLEKYISEFITTTDSRIMEAITLLYQTTGYVVEPAGAIGLAGVIENRDAWAGQNIALILSGGNLNENLYYLLG